MKTMFIAQRRKDAKEKHIVLIHIWKKKHLTVLFCIIIYNLLQIIPGYSQSDSLINYLEIAAKNNPVVLQRFNEYKASLQKIQQAGSLADPELSIGVFLKPMELVSGNQVADLRLMQMFPWFGVLKYAKDEMSLMANAKFELFRDAKLQVCYDVQRTWNELYKVENEIAISEKNIEILKTIERLSIVRFKSPLALSSGTSASTPGNNSALSQNNSAGSSVMQSMGNSESNPGSTESIPASSSMPSVSMRSFGSQGLADIYRIQIEEGDLDNNIESLKSQKKTTIAIFNSYLNRSPESPLFISATSTTDSLNYSLIAVSDSMLANNPMLDMLDYEKQSLEAREKMVSRMGYPMVGAGVNYSLINRNEMSTSSMNGKDMIMPMVTLTLPIYRKKYTAMKAEAEFMKEAALMNYQSTSNSLQNEYYQAVQLYNDAQRRIKLYNSQYDLATRSLKLIMKSFSVSAAELTDVLRVRQQTFDYELKKIQAITDLNTSAAWLRRLGNLEKLQFIKN
jgi:outer membrane protein TolC